MSDAKGSADDAEFLMNSDSLLNVSQLDVQSIFEAMPGCVVLVRPNGQIAYTTPDFHTLFHLAPGVQVVDTHISEWLDTSEEETRLRMQAGPVILSKLSTTVLRLKHGDGSFFLCEISSTPLKDPEGRFMGVISVLRDVTTSTRLEQRLHEHLESQQFLNHLLTLLYRPRNLKVAFAQVLEMIGIFMHASRVSLMENEADRSTAQMTMEWCSGDEPDGPAAADQAGEQHGCPPEKIDSIDFNAVPSLRVYAESRGVVCVPSEMTTPHDLYNLLRQWELRAFSILPVFGVDKLFGLIVIEYAHHQRTWGPDDMDLLRNITRTVSNAVARQQSEQIEYNQRVLVETLRDITSVVNSDFTFEQVLEYILVNLQRIVPYSASNILLVDEDQEKMRVAYARGYPDESHEFLNHFHQPIGQWQIHEHVANASQPLLVEDTLHNDAWVPAPGLDWVRSYIGAAIRSRGRLLGLLNVDGDQVNAFTPEHASRLQAFAGQAAVAIENALLYQEAHRRAEQMTTLYNIGLTLASGLDLEHVLTTVHDQVSRVLPIDHFYVALYDARTDIVAFPLFLERGRAISVPPRVVSEQPGLTGVVIRSRKTLYLADLLDPVTAAHYTIIKASPAESRTFVGVPLIAREQVVGVISMQSHQPNRFSREQVRLLETLANQAALAIDNASIFNEMKTLAITDSLTGLFTRRHFSALGQVEVERALRYGRGLGVLMVDIDLFKNINDSLGHAVGDTVLEGVSTLCRSQLRSSDIIGRYGGEEFAIVLPESDEERARSVAERIRAKVGATPINTARGTVQVTISVGLSLLGHEYNTLEVLLDCADRAMYQAKQAGRNRVFVCGDQT